jgi:hypothetical protein
MPNLLFVVFAIIRGPNMAIAVYSTYAPPSDMGGHDIVWFAEQMAARVRERIGQAPPAGGIYHAEGPTNDGLWWAFDVWESTGANEAFESSILRPALDSLGITPASEAIQMDVWWDSSQMPAPDQG